MAEEPLYLKEIEELREGTRLLIIERSKALLDTLKKSRISHINALTTENVSIEDIVRDYRKGTSYFNILTNSIRNMAQASDDIRVMENIVRVCDNILDKEYERDITTVEKDISDKETDE